MCNLDKKMTELQKDVEHIKGHVGEMKTDFKDFVKEIRLWHKEHYKYHEDRRKEYEKKYASKETEINQKKLGWYVLIAVVSALLSLIIKVPFNG